MHVPSKAQDLLSTTKKTEKTILMFGFESSPLNPRERSGESDAKIARDILERNKSKGYHSIIFTLPQTGHWLKSLVGEDSITVLDKKNPETRNNRSLSWFLEALDCEWKSILLDAEQLSLRKEEFKALTPDQRRAEVAKKISFWSCLIEDRNVSAYINSNIPHILDDFIAYQICKTQNIPTLCAYRFPIFPGSVSRLLFFEDPLNQETPMNLNNIKNEEIDENLLRLAEQLPKTKKQKQRSSATRKAKEKIKTTLGLHSITKHETTKIPENFIYFPLHYQPEASSRPLGGIWGNQLLLIETLASMLPKNLFLAVKEHPLQLKKGKHREKDFYRTINSLQNTTLVHHNISSEFLLKKSRAAVTLTGTIALESLTYNKRCLIFGTSVLKRAPNAITPKNTSELSRELEIISKNEETPIPKNKKIEFLEFIQEHSILGYLSSYTAPQICDQLTETENVKKVANIYTAWLENKTPY